jgi:hypothetical protein
MEKLPKKENISLVEKQRQEAFETVLNILVERFPVELKKSFESHGKEYALTSAEDCMVAFAQQNREAVEALYNEIKDKDDDYRSEQAVAKLYALFIAYEKTVALYAELRSYYPTVAQKVEEQLPPLSHIADHGSSKWKEINN